MKIQDIKMVGNVVEMAVVAEIEARDILQAEYFGEKFIAHQYPESVISIERWELVERDNHTWTIKYF